MKSVSLKKCGKYNTTVLHLLIKVQKQSNKLITHVYVMQNIIAIVIFLRKQQKKYWYALSNPAFFIRLVLYLYQMAQ